MPEIVKMEAGKYVLADGRKVTKDELKKIVENEPKKEKIEQPEKKKRSW